MSETQQTLSDTELGNKDQVQKYCREWKKDEKKRRNWFLTWNNYPTDGVETLKTLGKQAKYYVFQEEIGKKGTAHIQGVLCFNNAKSWSQVREKIKGWWAPCINVEKAKVYCSKCDTRIGPTHVKGFILKEAIKDIEPKGWQLDVVKAIKEEPDNRTVRWYWEPSGGVGKTVLAKHICLKYNAIYVSGKANDVKCAIAQMDVKPKIVIWDIPRCMEDYVSYQGIEEVKNGIFFSGKYESGMVIYNCPHVICFANFAPELEKLSLDRWKVARIYE